MGITKRAAPISWRPSAEAGVALAKLLEGGRKRNDILNEIVVRAAAGPAEVSLSPEPEIIEAGKLAELPSPAPKAAKIKPLFHGNKPTVYRQTISKPGWKK